MQIACKLTGFRVAEGNTWWYQVALSPWSNSYYASADAFYNNGQTSGSLNGTPFVDNAVPDCSGSSGSSGSSGGSGGGLKPAPPPGPVTTPGPTPPPTPPTPPTPGTGVSDKQARIAAAIAARTTAAARCGSDSSGDYVNYMQTVALGPLATHIKMKPGKYGRLGKLASAAEVNDTTGTVWNILSKCLSKRSVPLTNTERRSSCLQLKCHIYFARYSNAFGDTYDLETYRSADIPTDPIREPAFFYHTRCNL